MCFFLIWLLAVVIRAGFSPLAGNPGSGNKLRPDYTLVKLRPDGFKPNVSALAWLDEEKDKLLVVEWSKGGNKQVEIRQFNGTIYLLEGVANANGPGDVKVNIFKDKLEIPTGVVVLGDTVYVTSGFTLDGHFDSNNDGVADKVHKVFDFGYAKKCRHEFFMGLIYQGGDFYASASRCKDEPTRPAGVHGNTWQMHKERGALLKINRQTGKAEFLSGGLREPFGMGVGPGNDMFECDNQGNWLPGSKMVHLQNGKFYGFHADNFSLEEDYGPAFKGKKETPPAIWMPHSVASHSPTHPLLVRHGIFKGHMLVGDMAYGGIQRAFLEKVNGEWQGAYFNWSGGFESGVGALLWGPGNSLIVGGQGKGDVNNWGWCGQKEGLEKIVPRPAAPVVFEPLAIRSRKNGFEIEFTKAVDEAAALNKANYKLTRFEQQPQKGYGAGNMAARAKMEVAGVTLSPDKKNVFLQVDISGQVYRGGRLQGNTVVDFTLDATALTSQTGDKVWVNRAWYTLNSVSASSAFQVNGCKDPAYAEYNKDAEVDDGNCVNLKSASTAAGPLREPFSVTGKSGKSGKEFNVISSIAPKRVELRGLNGKLVQSFKINSEGRYFMRKGGAGFGLYLFTVSAGGRTISRKVVLE